MHGGHMGMGNAFSTGSYGMGWCLPVLDEALAALLTDLKDDGCDWREHEDGYRLFLADGIGPDTIFRAARACGVQVRYLRPSSESLEDVFLRALGHEG